MAEHEIAYCCDRCGWAWHSATMEPCPECGYHATPAWQIAAKDPHNWADWEPE